MNRLMILLLMVISSTLSAQMRDEKDKVITKAVISQFRRECSHKAGIDQGKVVDLQKIYDAVRKDKTNEGQAALTCYQDRMSQLIGIHQLYKDLCEDVSKDDVEKRTESDQLRLLLMTQRYRKGITPFHDLLNDCLTEKSNNKYIVKTGRFRTEGATLLKELDKLNTKRPFEADPVLFR